MENDSEIDKEGIELTEVLSAFRSRMRIDNQRESMDDRGDVESGLGVCVSVG
jgi:hypothetical protein